MRTAEMTLSGGRQVQLAMPDMYTIMAGVRSGRAPNPGLAAVIRLLEGTGALESQGLLQRLAALAEYYQGLYEVAALCLVSPRLRLDGGEAGADEITPRDLSFNDAQLIYYNFFRTDPPADRGPGSELISAAIGQLYANGASPADAAAFLAALSGTGGVAVAGSAQPSGPAAAASDGDGVSAATK